MGVCIVKDALHELGDLIIDGNKKRKPVEVGVAEITSMRCKPEFSMDAIRSYAVAINTAGGEVIERRLNHFDVRSLVGLLRDCGFYPCKAEVKGKTILLCP